MGYFRFSKYHGTGNDFVMVDNRALSFPKSTEYIACICHRRFGIGADGLILLENHPEYDFRMVYYNSDGRESSMCGNGGRCISAFAAQLGIGAMGSKLRFEAIDGYHEAALTGQTAYGYQVDLLMKNVNGPLETRDQAVILNTGSPHYVTLYTGLDALDIVPAAQAIRYDAPFKAEGINVNFIEPVEGGIRIRTYERGVEDETYSCGTGVVAASIAAQYLLPGHPHTTLITKGGTLAVNYHHADHGFHDVHLIGPAEKVFEGEFPLP